MKMGASIALLLSILLTVTAYAQQVPTKPIMGGVLNGKAISLPRPAYPPAAREVGASGAVTVQVLVDENGVVISATATSGHPLLRANAVEAARAAAFSPTTLNGEPVKVSGVITYNFVPPVTVVRMFFVLSHANETGTFGKYVTPESLARQLLQDWIQERELLNSLTFEKELRDEEVPPRRQQTSEPVLPPDTNSRYTGLGDIPSSSESHGSRKLDSASRDTLRLLTAMIEKRAREGVIVSWVCDLGGALGMFVAEANDEAKFQSHVSRIESLLEHAPQGIKYEPLRLVNEFVTFAKNADTDEARIESIAKAEALSNLRY